jgi:hypothetical protein
MVPRVNRRTFLKVGGAAGAVSALGGLEGISRRPRSFSSGSTWEKTDEALKPFRTAGRGSRMIGYAGSPSAKATEVYSKYIITDMYARAVQGMPPEEAIRWAENELRKVYEG